MELPKLEVGVNAVLNRVEFEEMLVYDYTYYCEEFDYTFNFEVYIILPHTHDYAYELVPAGNLGVGRFYLKGVCKKSVPTCENRQIAFEVAVELISNTSTCTTAGRQVWQHERNGVIYECRTNLPIFADHIYQIADNEMVKPSYEKEGLGIIICTECNHSANVVLPIVENGVNALVVGNETIDGIDYEVINYIYYSADYNYTFDFNIYNIACDHEHTIDIVTAPTCLSYGYTTTICYDCSTVIVEEFDVVPPIPHCIAEFTGEAVAGEWELAEDMTEHCECVENLLYFAICQYGCGIDFTSPEYSCNDNYVIMIINVSHVYGEWHDVMPLEGIPTCMQDRLQARECIICYENGNILHNESTGCVQTKVVGASNGHQPGKGVVENYVAPTCESWGSFETAYYCTGCGVEIEELRLVDIIRPIEHNYIVDESISPTKEQEGLGVVKCTECNTSANVVLPIVEIGVNAEMVGIENSNSVGYEIINYTYHSAEYNCTFEFVIRNLCNPCDHQPSDGVVMNEVSPTCEEDGRYDVVYYCTKCNIEIYREEKIIEGTAFGHKLADDHQTVFAVVEGTHSVTLPCAACDEDLEYVFVIDGEPTATGHCHNHYDTYTVTATGVTGEIELTIKVANESYDHDAVPALGDSSLVFVKGNGSYDSWLYLCTKCGDWRIAYIIPK